MDIYKIGENNQNDFCRGKTYLTSKTEFNTSKWIAKFYLISTGGLKKFDKTHH